MNMKKMLSLALAGVMALSLMACSAQNGGDSSENTSSPSSSQSGGETQNGGAPESVTITSLNANKEAAELEVPYDPQRIAILDMASLDILDALGVGDRVVGTADTSLEYLQTTLPTWAPSRRPIWKQSWPVSRMSSLSVAVWLPVMTPSAKSLL